MEQEAGLAGRIAIVTGAGGGLGREYALLLAKRGVKVVVNDYGGTLDGVKGTTARADEVVAEIEEAGGTAVANGSDVSVQEEVRALVALAVQTFGRVDILINNAGTAGQASAHNKINVESFRRTWEIACLGSVLLISEVYDLMERQGYGRIVNTSSDSIYGFGGGGDGGYASSKGAVYALTRDLGRFSEQHGIKINGVLPSAVSRMSDLSPIIKTITHQYFKTEKVAVFVAALASEQCPVSGELFSVGGGRAARTTLATFPGHTSESVEGFLSNFNAVMGSAEDAFIPSDTMEQVSFAISHATGVHVSKADLNGLL
jgi:NAD(P)-dependent dehydrogenase (short-subunit alcohol dehydrogenase family)